MAQTATVMHSSIRILPAASFQVGICAVCENPSVLKWVDTCTGWIVGDCCVQSLVDAERNLNFPPAELRPPNAGESDDPPGN